MQCPAGAARETTRPADQSWPQENLKGRKIPHREVRRQDSTHQSTTANANGAAQA